MEIFNCAGDVVVCMSFPGLVVLEEKSGKRERDFFSDIR